MPWTSWTTGRRGVGGGGGSFCEAARAASGAARTSEERRASGGRIRISTLTAVVPRRDREAAPAHQGGDPGIPAAEGAVGLGRIDRVAGREDVPSEARRPRPVEGTAGLGERLEGVGATARPPTGSVVAGRVAVAARTRARTGAGGGASRSRAACRARPGSRARRRPDRRSPPARWSFMSTSAAERYSTVAKPWLNCGRALDPLDQAARDGLPGLVMQREAAQHLRREQPALEQLRRELDVVARDRGAGEGRVLDAGGSRPCSAWPNSWNRVSASSQQTRTGSPGRALHEVGVVGDDGGDLAVEPLLVAVGVHPGAGALARRGRRGRSTRAPPAARRRRP